MSVIHHSSGKAPHFTVKYRVLGPEPADTYAAVHTYTDVAPIIPQRESHVQIEPSGPIYKVRFVLLCPYLDQAIIGLDPINS